MKQVIRGLAAPVLLALTTAACSTPQAQTIVAPEWATIERGKYLVTVGGCNDCHTPLKIGPNGPEPDTSRMLSGHPEALPVDEAVQPTAPWMALTAQTGTAFSGPWGVSFAANLTPDNNTGIGIWTEEMFVKTLRTGRHWGTSRAILPPMPWLNYAKMTDDDLKAVYAFLRSIKPISNHVREPLPPRAVATEQ